MNKETIKKYQAEFNHWLNEGRLLWTVARNKPNWTQAKETHTDFFNTNDKYYIYIIDDEYRELRKALAEGKTIQFNFGNFGPNKTDFQNIWKDLDLSIGILSDRALPENYRIKPEFKVGDWLYNIPYNKYYRIENVLEDRVETKTFRVYKSAINGIDYSLWKPKQGEWCIVDNSENEDIHISFMVHQWQLDSKWTPIPYTGSLPHFIKD